MAENDELIGKLFATLLGRKKLSVEQLAKLKQIVDDFDEVSK